MSFNSRKQSVGSISRSTSALEPFQTAFSVVLDLARFGNHLSYVTGNKPDQNSRGTDFVVPFSTFRAVSEQSLNSELYCLALSQRSPTTHSTLLLTPCIQVVWLSYFTEIAASPSWNPHQKWRMITNVKWMMKFNFDSSIDKSKLHLNLSKMYE